MFEVSKTRRRLLLTGAFAESSIIRLMLQYGSIWRRIYTLHRLTLVVDGEVVVLGSWKMRSDIPFLEEMGNYQNTMR
jgi:hypothetical protein